MNDFDDLTPREQAILRAYVTHGDLREIARELGLAHATVKNHSSEILAATGCVAIGQAAARFAVHEALLGPDLRSAARLHGVPDRGRPGPRVAARAVA